ncbi:MAG: GDP-L-fucose synthase [Candidatus Sumerlaeia bacterium]|nr:GDP-L-fucose synthase [Candidatus Sumerlaeia bacterium]
MDLSGKRILLTGGAGFLGARVAERLAARGCARVFVPRSARYDLTDASAAARLFEEVRPEVVIHLAAVVGGIGANRANPGRFFHDNALMGIHLIEGARRAGIEKFVAVGTICSYPKFTPVPFREEELWDGYPEETNAPYGLAKKMHLVMLQAYREQYGLNGIYLLPVNMYGPGDHFDLANCHVVPALLRKCREALRDGRGEIEVWGTGRATREFLYVADAAEAVVLAAERYDGAEPVNIGVGAEISIRELAELVARVTGFRGSFRWDASKPDGQPRRMLDTSRARERFGFTARTTLEDGLRATWEWYKAQP